MDKFRIDAHKLIYHVPRVHQWLLGENIYPIYLEIGLYGGCNHHCIFCAFDFLKYKPDILDTDCLKRFILAAAKKGIKSILYSGEGEPLLHNDIAKIVAFTKKTGIDNALVTNGVILDKVKAKKLLKHLSWVKISLDAGSENSYSSIHGTRKEDFKTVLSNLNDAVKIRNKNKYRCAIGVQSLLIPQNYKEIIPLAKILSSLGVDYLVIKPYCKHPLSKQKTSFSLEYKKLFNLEKALTKYSRKGFQIVFRRQAMEKDRQKKSYKHCLGLPFAAHITAKGDIYPCNVFLGRSNFAFGNIYQHNFAKIWEGARRRKIMQAISRKWDMQNCRNACRLDEINRYLWELKNPVDHVNFI